MFVDVYFGERVGRLRGPARRTAFRGRGRRCRLLEGWQPSRPGEAELTAYALMHSCSSPHFLSSRSAAEALLELLQRDVAHVLAAEASTECAEYWRCSS